MASRLPTSISRPFRAPRSRILAPGWLALACWAGSALVAGAQEAAEEAGAAVVRGTVDGDIDHVAAAYVKRLTEWAKERDAKALLLELNTFGGRVDSAVAIRDALIDLEIPTIVFVNKRAISAGALISLACDKIVMSPGGTIGAATPVMSGPGTEVPQAVEEKYVSYFREEMRSTAETNGRDPDIAEAMVDSDKEIEGVIEKGKLLTLTTKRAVELKVADAEAESAAEALEKMGYSGASEELERSWSESLVGFLTSQSVASLLLLTMMVFAYLEYQTPGFGIFGGTAIACFLVLFFSHYMVNLAGWEELILFVLAIALLSLELFVIPGFGIAGILGLLCLLASAVLMLMAGDWSDFSFSNPFTLAAVQRVMLSILLGIGVLVLLIRLMPKSGFSTGGGLILGEALGAGTGEAPRPAAPRDELVGQEGTALTALRPAGKVRIGDRRYEGESEGDFIALGSRVKVLRRSGSRLIVRPVASGGPHKEA